MPQSVPTTRSKSSVAFAIHDLNYWGGQDRSTLEIVRRLARRDDLNIEVHSFTLETSGGETLPVTVKKILPHIQRPLFFKILLYYWVTGLRWMSLGKSREVLIHATGACSLISDVIQVQFVHAAWKKEKKTLQEKGFQPREKRSLRGIVLGFYHFFLQEFNIAMEKLVFSKRKTYIAISEVVAKELRVNYGLDNIRVSRHGVDSAVFRPAFNENEVAARKTLRASLGIGDSQTALLYVGSYERKGLATVIKSLALLPVNLRGEIKLVVVGGGDREKYSSLAKSLKVADLISWVGPTKEVVRYYQASDIFLLPTGYEPFGLVILEAMACGLVPIVSSIAGASELITPEVDGFLLDDPSNASDCAKLLACLLADPDLRTKMSKMARKRAESCSWDKTAAEYEVILRQKLNGSVLDPGRSQAELQQPDA